MKKIVMIALLLTLAMGTTITQAQQGNGKGPGGNGNPASSFAHNPADRLTEQLGLDEVQAAEVAAIFEASHLLREEEREKNREVACEIRENTHAQIMAVLTPEQLALFDDMQQRRQEMRQAFEEMQQENGGRGFGHGRRGMLECDD